MYICRIPNKGSPILSPSDVWLKYVDGFALDELTEPISRVLVLPCREQAAGIPQRLFDLLVAVVVIGGQELFDPLHVVRFYSLGQLPDRRKGKMTGGEDETAAGTVARTAAETKPPPQKKGGGAGYDGVESSNYLNRVLRGEAHIAVDHEREVRSDGLSPCSHLFHVLLQPFGPFHVAVRQRKLRRHKTQLLG